MAFRKEVKEIERKVVQLLDRIVDASSDTIALAYEKRITELETQKALMQDRLANCGKPLQSFGEAYRTAFDFLASPWKLWNSPRLEDRRAVLKLAFADQLAYVKGEGYRTANISMPIKLLGSLGADKKEMLRHSAVEPPVSRRPRNCSRPTRPSPGRAASAAQPPSPETGEGRAPLPESWAQ